MFAHDNPSAAEYVGRSPEGANVDVIRPVDESRQRAAGLGAARRSARGRLMETGFLMAKGNESMQKQDASLTWGSLALASTAAMVTIVKL